MAYIMFIHTLVHTELYMGWVDPRVELGWVGLGLVGSSFFSIFLRLVWVGSNVEFPNILVQTCFLSASIKISSFHRVGSRFLNVKGRDFKISIGLGWVSQSLSWVDWVT